ncbi:cytochrome c biogenesis CcdA family protein, partial [Corynebacterium nasicanis]
RGTGRAQVFALGTVYGLAGFCAGPLLGAVLTTAAVTGSPLYGGLVLGMYAVGMALPLFVLALLWDRLELGTRAWLRPRAVRLGPLRTTVWALVSGGLFIAIGWLFIASHGTANLPGLLSMDASYEVQAWAQRVTGTVSDVAFWFWVSLAGTVLSGWRLAGSTRRSAPRPR